MKKQQIRQKQEETKNFRKASQIDESEDDEDESDSDIDDYKSSPKKQQEKKIQQSPIKVQKMPVQNTYNNKNKKIKTPKTNSQKPIDSRTYQQQIKQIQQQQIKSQPIIHEQTNRVISSMKQGKLQQQKQADQKVIQRNGNQLKAVLKNKKQQIINQSDQEESSECEDDDVDSNQNNNISEDRDKKQSINKKNIDKAVVVSDDEEDDSDDQNDSDEDDQSEQSSQQDLKHNSNQQKQIKTKNKEQQNEDNSDQNSSNEDDDQSDDKSNTCDTQQDNDDDDLNSELSDSQEIEQLLVKKQQALTKQIIEQKQMKEDMNSKLKQKRKVKQQVSDSDQSHSNQNQKVLKFTQEYSDEEESIIVSKSKSLKNQANSQIKTNERGKQQSSKVQFKSTNHDEIKNEDKLSSSQSSLKTHQKFQIINDELLQLKLDYSLLKTENASLSEKCGKLSDLYNQSLKDNENLQDDILSLQNLNKNHEYTLQEKDFEMAVKRSEMSDLSQQILERNVKITTLEDEMYKLRDQLKIIDQLKSDLKKRSEELAIIKAKYYLDMYRIEFKIVAEYPDLHEENTQLQNENEELKSQVFNLENEIKQSSSLLQNYQVSDDEQITYIQQLEQQNTQMSQQIHQLQAQETKINEQLQLLQVQNKRMDLEIQSKNDELEERLENFSKVLKSNEQLRLSLKNVKAQFQKFKTEKFQELENQVSDKDNEIKLLKEMVRGNQLHIKMKEKELYRMKQKLMIGNDNSSVASQYQNQYFNIHTPGSNQLSIRKGHFSSSKDQSPYKQSGFINNSSISRNLKQPVFNSIVTHNLTQLPTLTQASHVNKSYTDIASQNSILNDHQIADLNSSSIQAGSTSLNQYSNNSKDYKIRNMISRRSAQISAMAAVQKNLNSIQQQQNQQRVGLNRQKLLELSQNQRDSQQNDSNLYKQEESGKNIEVEQYDGRATVDTGFQAHKQDMDDLLAKIPRNSQGSDRYLNSDL
eukprot:403353640